jgi:putative tryptophan/tyrosine transport system substrate-binding protein
MIERRSLLLALASLSAMVSSARAQSPGRIYRVGLLGPGPLFTDKNPYVAGLTKAFAKRGYTVGGNLVFETRAAQGKVERLPQLVDELNASHLDLMITVSFPAALAAKEHAEAPVVVINSGDPVATRLVASLARPGGNVTGVSEVATELSAKRLQLLKETVPSARKVAMLWNADDLGMTLRYQSADAAAKTLGLAVQPLGVREPDDFNSAFAAMDKDPPDGILMVSDVLTLLNRKLVFEYAAAHKLPAIFEYDSLVHEGGLMSYGPDSGEVLDHATVLSDRILKGAKPADLPLEEPTRYVLALNLKTAAALGLAIPPAVLARADDVIE